MVIQRSSTTLVTERSRDWTTRFVWTYPALPNSLHNHQDADLKPDYSEKHPVISWSWYGQFFLDVIAEAYGSVSIFCALVCLLLEESEVSYVHGLLRMPSVFISRLPRLEVVMPLALQNFYTPMT